MGRPLKLTVDFFSHDCDTQNKKTVDTLERKYSNDGYAFWFKTLEMLGRTEGHYLDCRDSETWEHFVAKMGITESFCDGILNTLVKLKAIDSDLWVNHRVIWCQHFVTRLKPIYDKRRQELPLKPSFRDGNTIKSDSAPISVTKTPQREEREQSKAERAEREKPVTPVTETVTPSRKPPKRKPYHEWTDEEIAVAEPVDQCQAIFDRFYFQLTGYPPDRNYAEDGAKFKAWLAKGWKVQEWLPLFFKQAGDREIKLGGYTTGVFRDWVRRAMVHKAQSKRKE